MLSVIEWCFVDLHDVWTTVLEIFQHNFEAFFLIVLALLHGLAGEGNGLVGWIFFNCPYTLGLRFGRAFAGWEVQ